MVVNIRWTKVGGGVKIFPNIKYSLKKQNKKCWVQTVWNSSWNDCSAMELGRKFNFCFCGKKEEDHLYQLAITPSHPMWKNYPPSGSCFAECMPAYLCVNEWERCLKYHLSNLDWKHLKGSLKALNLVGSTGSLNCDDDEKGGRSPVCHMLYFNAQYGVVLFDTFCGLGPLLPRWQREPGLHLVFYS